MSVNADLRPKAPHPENRMRANMCGLYEVVDQAQGHEHDPHPSLDRS